MRGAATAASIALLLLALASPAQAQRPDTRSMTCQGVWTFVQSRGAVVMTTGRHTYDRIVSSRRYCFADEVLQRHYAQTANSPRCFVGYVCRQPIRPFDFFNRD